MISLPPPVEAKTLWAGSHRPNQFKPLPSLILGSSPVRLSRAWKELLRLNMNESLTSHNFLAVHELLKTHMSPNKGPTAVLGKVGYLPPAPRGQASVLILTCREQRRKDAQKDIISALLNSFLFLVLMISCYSVTQSCLPLCDPMDCRMPGFPVLHHLPELAQIHVHWVSDAIQPLIIKVGVKLKDNNNNQGHSKAFLTPKGWIPSWRLRESILK